MIEGEGTVVPQPGLRFASCRTCGREMSGTACSVTERVIGGRSLARTPYAKILPGMDNNCNDCNAPVGKVHHRGCDQDRCPVPGCNSQAAFCEHQDEGWPAPAGRRTARRRPSPQ